MKKRNWLMPIALFSLLFSLLAYVGVESTIIPIPSDGIWKVVGLNETVCFTNKSYTLNLGSDQTTDYLLNINGSLNINGYTDQRGDFYLRKNRTLNFGYDGSHTSGYFTNWVGLGTLLYSFTQLNLTSTDDIQIKSHTGFVNIYADKDTNIYSNTYIDKDLTVNNTCTAKEFIGYGIVHIGSLNMWLQNLTNTPILPDGWEIADGHVCGDVDSVYNGVTLPNLTSMFIKGATNSGSTGGNNTHALALTEMPKHNHTYSDVFTFASVSSLGTPMTLQSGTNRRITNTYESTADLLTGDSGDGQQFDNQPSYYTVVYIIRVK